MTSTKTKLINFLNSHDFGEEIFVDYYRENNHAGYMEDRKKFEKAKKDALDLLSQLGEITDEEIKEACARAFSGRLSFDGENFKYNAGQFYDLEVPQAVLSVAWYIESARDLVKSLS